MYAINIKYLFISNKYLSLTNTFSSIRPYVSFKSYSRQLHCIDSGLPTGIAFFHRACLPPHSHSIKIKNKKHRTHPIYPSCLPPRLHRVRHQERIPFHNAKKSLFIIKKKLHQRLRRREREMGMRRFHGNAGVAPWLAALPRIPKRSRRRRARGNWMHTSHRALGRGRSIISLSSILLSLHPLLLNFPHPACKVVRRSDLPPPWKDILEDTWCLEKCPSHLQIDFGDKVPCGVVFGNVVSYLLLLLIWT